MSTSNPVDVTIQVGEGGYGLSYNSSGLSLHGKGNLEGDPAMMQFVKGSLLFSALPKNGGYNVLCSGRLETNGTGSITFKIDDGSTATMTVTSIESPPEEALHVSGAGFWTVNQS
jgi:hypothetical protein